MSAGGSDQLELGAEWLPRAMFRYVAIVRRVNDPIGATVILELSAGNGHEAAERAERDAANMQPGGVYTAAGGPRWDCIAVFTVDQWGAGTRRILEGLCTVHAELAEVTR